MELIMLGDGGHARSVADALAQPLDAVAVPDVRPGQRSKIAPKVIAERELLEMARDSVLLINGLGQMAPAGPQQRVYRTFVAEGFAFATVVHEKAVVAESASIGPGAQVLGGAVVGPFSSIGANTTVNSGAVVEHDCRIGDHVHIAPGAVVCGEVVVGDGSMVGAGATVIPTCQVGSNTQVAAGATVIGDVGDSVLVTGTPARTHRHLA